METVSNMWNALTVENEKLVSLSFIPMIFIELTISMLLFTTILQIKRTKKQSFIYVVSLSLIGIITHLFVPEPYNTFINIFMLPAMVFICFKTSILFAILSEVVQYIIYLFFGVILENIYTTIFNISAEQLTYIPIHKMAYSALLYISLIGLYFLLKVFYPKFIKIVKKFDNRAALVLNFIVGTIAIIIDAYVLAKYISFIPFTLVFTNIFVLIIYFMISMYSLFRTTKLEKTTMDLEEQKLYNKTLAILYDNVRGFKHDFNNIVQSIGGYIDSNNIDGLKSYYKELLKDCQAVNNLNLLNPETINNPAIYSLLTSKYHKAEELGIKINLEAFLDLNTLDVNIYKFTRILGILLDNAIEACSASAEKVINIFIRRDTRVKRKLFIIENTYSNKDVDTDKIFEKGYTSKSNENSNNHGLGLWEVRKIIKKSKNLNLFTTKTNQFFKQQLEIYDEKL